ncbi:hypothetical protein JKF63_03011 [Porcisia hertigi]|uniref:ATP-grasp domain-containing protein n=1 Tax=Porcisia hertigi TaxID=2761500 RepID=A0A836IE57_9TRYP|nr:hypothetical protein JKF63_03011 [Porcisia hertigi]
MLRHRWPLWAATAATAPTRTGELANSFHPSPSSSLTHAAECVSPMPVYLKPSSSPRRKASFYFPRMRDACLPAYAFRPSALGSALPLFSITSPSCEYYALRLPLLKAGFRRVPPEARDIASNLVWGRSMPFCEMLRRGQSAPLLDFPTTGTAEQDAYVERLRLTHPQQRYNHFPLSHVNLGCKRGMAANVRRAFEEAMRHASTPGEREAVEARYRFVPRTWFYPQERESLLAAMKAAPSNRHFIWKPSRGSCGRGILISQAGAEHAPTWERIMEEIKCRSASKETRRLFSSYVVQEYIENPFLVEGRKMDLRLYVAVTSYNPLTIYLHEEGLVRFAAEPYTEATVRQSSTSNTPASEAGDSAAQLASVSSTRSTTCSDFNTKHMRDRFRHLTNYSVGKRYTVMQHHNCSRAPLTTDTDAMEGTATSSESAAPGPVLKWSLWKLWDYIDAHSTSAGSSPTGFAAPRRASDGLLEEIAQLITRTLFAVRPVVDDAVRRVSMPGSYFEVYGFDVMLDADLNPFLIEVNTLPSLESSSAFDYATKTNVVADLLNLAMLEPFERRIEPGSTLWNSSHLREDMHRSPGAPEQGLLHAARISDGNLDACGAPNLTREDVELRLRDELAYARGFHRIFPAKETSHSSSQKIDVSTAGSFSAMLDPSTSRQPLDSLATCRSYQADLRAYEREGLTEKDTWALAS